MHKPKHSMHCIPLTACCRVAQSILSDRMRIGGSLARAAIKDLAEKGLIKPVVKHAKQLIYTRAGASA